MASLRGKWAVWTAIALVCGQGALSLFAGRSFALTVYGDLAQSLLLTLGLIAMCSNAARSHGRRRLFWGLLSAGFALWLVSQLLWSYYEVLTRHEVPNPFIADVVVFIHLVPMMGALTLQVEKEGREGVLNLGSIDVLALLCWWLYLYIFAVIPWQFVIFDVARYGSSFNVLYLAEQLVFLFGLAMLWWKSRDDWKRTHGHLFGAALLYALSSYVIDVAIDLHRYYTGSSFDIPLMMSQVWFVWVGVLASNIEPSRVAVRTSSMSTGLWAGRLAMMATLSIPVFGVWAAFAADDPRPVRNFRLAVTLAAMVLLTFLVFLKQYVLNSQLAVLLRRSEEALERMKRMQAQLVQSEKLVSLGQLVAGAAHEINNPLTAILGFADLLSETPSVQPEQKKIAGEILQQARRTKELVASLLKFAKQAPVTKALLNVNSIVQTALKLSQERLHAQNVKIHLQLGSVLPPISGDRNQLLQVFLHIIRNATDAMENSPERILAAATRRENGSVIIEFSDTGPGMEQPERVFDPFYTTKAVGKGAGLGLSACYGIVTEHGGRIRCENAARGARFQVELPVAQLN